MTITRCPYARNLPCYLCGDCPITQDLDGEKERWFSKLLRWSQTGRSPRTTDWSSYNATPDIGSSGRQAERMAQMAVLFVDPLPVLDFLDGVRFEQLVRDGKRTQLMFTDVPMTREICKDILRARWMWSEAQLGYFTDKLKMAEEYEKEHCSKCGNKKPCGVHSKNRQEGAKLRARRDNGVSAYPNG